MMFELPQTARIHELVRALDKNPNDYAAEAELGRLQRERAAEIDKVLQEQAVTELDEREDIERQRYQDELKSFVNDMEK